MSVEDIKREIEKGWRDVPAGDVALRIIDFMAGLKDQELRMLTIPTLLRVAERDEVDQSFLAALAILASSTIHVLDAKAFFWVSEDHEVHVDAGKLAEARRTGSLELADTGELVEDFEGKLIPYFQSSERFLEARVGG